MTIREMRTRLGDTQSEFAARYGIPFRTIQNWETGKRIPPDYILNLLQMRVDVDVKNRKTIVLPEHDSRKKDLPDRRDYVGAISWLKAVSNADDKVLADMTRRALNAEIKSMKTVITARKDDEDVYPAVCPGHPGNTGF